MKPEQRDEAIRVAFQKVFGVEGNRSIEQRVVMAWLTRFCRKRSSTFETRDRDHALYLEGRREVLIEIEKRIDPPEPTVDQILHVTGESTNE